METQIGRQGQARRKSRATTREVVGKKPGSPEGIPRKWREHYARLVDLRERFLSRQSDLSRHALEEQPSFSMHMADAGTDAYDRDLALGMLSAEQDAVYEIDEAVNRLRNGSYGICELTRKPIEARRLAAVPWTRFCAAAEKQLEREGALKHPQLGPPKSVAEFTPAVEPEQPEEAVEPEESQKD